MAVICRRIGIGMACRAWKAGQFGQRSRLPVFGSLGFALMMIGLLLPETKGRSLDSLEQAAE
jgi:hypothetical protein